MAKREADPSEEPLSLEDAPELTLALLDAAQRGPPRRAPPQPRWVVEQPLEQAVGSGPTRGGVNHDPRSRRHPKDTIRSSVRRPRQSIGRRRRLGRKCRFGERSRTPLCRTVADAHRDVYRQRRRYTQTSRPRSNRGQTCQEEPTSQAETGFQADRPKTRAFSGFLSDEQRQTVTTVRY